MSRIMWSIRRSIQTTTTTSTIQRNILCRQIHSKGLSNSVSSFYWNQKGSCYDDNIFRLNHNKTCFSTTPTTTTASLSSFHQILKSPRKVAKLEDDLLQVLSNEVKDPIIPTISPQFRSVSFHNLPTITSPQQQYYGTNIPDSSKTLLDDDHPMMMMMIPTITVTLRSSTSLLHPAMDELKLDIQRVLSKQLSMENLNIQVQLDASNTKPTPWISNNSNASNVQDYISKIGPGLQNVAHTVAVYSCKVRQSFGSPKKKKESLV